MADDAGKYVIGGLIAVVALFFLSQSGVLGGTPAVQLPPTTVSQTGQIVPLQCSVAPTVDLSASDKFTSGQTNWGNWKYKLNGRDGTIGATKTDADGNFEVRIDSGLEVLVADANSSKYYRAIWKPKIDGCGVNPDSYNDAVLFTTFESKCKNEDGDSMNASTYSNNLTIGLEGTRNVKCVLDGIAKKGMPYGGVWILEFNQSTYDSSLMEFTWDGASIDSTTTSSAYTVGVAGSTTKSYQVPGFTGSAEHLFTLNLVAKSNINPGAHGGATISSYGDGVLARLYPINCFEEEDLSPSEFKCAVEDKDDTFTSPGGTTKTAAQVSTLIIPVD